MSFQTWEITAGDDRAKVASFGGVLISWQVQGAFPDPLWANVANESKIYYSEGKPIPVLRQIREMVDGYHTKEELYSRDGFRSALLAPWPNRMAGQKYEFQGKQYNLDNSPVGGPQALHGLAHSLEFAVKEQEANRIVLVASIPPCEGYPFNVDLEVEYQIFTEPHRLNFRLEAFNRGKTDAPISLGWHPYFRAQTGGVESLMVTLPAEVGVNYDEEMIPKPGIAGFQQLANPVSFAHREDLDYGLTQLVNNENDMAVVEISHADGCYTKVGMKNIDSTLGHSGFQVYSGQYLAHRPGEAIAVEPVLNMTDAFNRPECLDDITVSPGQGRKLESVIEFGYNGH